MTMKQALDARDPAVLAEWLLSWFSPEYARRCCAMNFADTKDPIWEAAGKRIAA